MASNQAAAARQEQPAVSSHPSAAKQQQPTHHTARSITPKHANRNTFYTHSELSGAVWQPAASSRPANTSHSTQHCSRICKSEYLLHVFRA